MVGCALDYFSLKQMHTQMPQTSVSRGFCLFFVIFFSFLLKEINKKMEKECGHTGENALFLFSEHHLDLYTREGHLVLTSSHCGTDY